MGSLSRAGGLPNRDPMYRDPLDRDRPHTVKSEWYASFWNAFLFYVVFDNIIQIIDGLAASLLPIPCV